LGLQEMENDAQNRAMPHLQLSDLDNKNALGASFGTRLARKFLLQPEKVRQCDNLPQFRPYSRQSAAITEVDSRIHHDRYGCILCPDSACHGGENTGFVAAHPTAHLGEDQNSCGRQNALGTRDDFCLTFTRVVRGPGSLGFASELESE
jgi:hypothetical protein